MIKKLRVLLGISRGPCSEKIASGPKTKRPGGGDFRAIEIVPSIDCCAAATRAAGRSYLLRDAPRLPLYGCTRPTTCSCKFLKGADRRHAIRRLLRATETKRLFAGLESRKRGRRSAET